MKANRSIAFLVLFLGAATVSLVVPWWPSAETYSAADDHEQTDAHAHSEEFAQSHSTHAVVQPVNVVVGDAGYVAAYGVLPHANVSEDVRIETHLAYIEQLLRARSVNHLSPEQVRRRNAALDYLRTYRIRGEFPRNTAHPGRRIPVFIDGDGRICAVGYLIEQTAGRAAARAINARFQFAYISEMDTSDVPGWADRNGFTLRELAMIQPNYCGDSPEPPGCPATKAEVMNRTVGLASLGINATSALLNGWMASRPKRNLLVAGGGLLAGGAGLAVGISGDADFRTATMVTAGASVLLSGWNLLRKPRSREERPGERLTASPDLVPIWIADGLGTDNPGVKMVWTF